MIPMDVREATQTTAFTLPQWSPAEFLDMPYVDGLVLRALICRLAPGKWQWSVMSIDGDRGELIGIGNEGSLAQASATAACEIDKCMRDPLH
jgi:hypothetical protein